MRDLIFVSAFALIVGGCAPERTTLPANAGASEAPGGQTRRSWRPDATSDQPIEASSATMWVKGLSCPLCANNVDKQLKRVPGVTNVTVDLGDGKVSVKLADAGRPTRRDLAKAIEKSGFTLDRIETP